MSRPVTPCRPVRTEEILTAADSSSFSARCFSRVRSPARSRRYRVCSRSHRLLPRTAQPLNRTPQTCRSSPREPNQAAQTLTEPTVLQTIQFDAV
jgi:hypothetical protein